MQGFTVLNFKQEQEYKLSKIEFLYQHFAVQVALIGF